MKWFDNWFQYQCEKAWNAKHMNSPTVCVKATEDIIDYRKSYTIKMQPANGGTILEVSHFNTQKDDWTKDLYIIGSDEDVGTEITKILVQYRLTHA